MSAHHHRFQAVSISILLAFVGAGWTCALDHPPAGSSPESTPPLPASLDVATLEAQAAQGDPEAQYRLGQIHLRGLDGRKDLRRAYELIKQAADQGHPEALGGVGYFYAQGIIVNKDLVEAVAWFRKGAKKGGAKAELNLGQALLHGRGVTANVAEGLEWIDRAAGQGLPHAIYVQGELHFYAKFGGPQDHQKALSYFLAAAKTDYAPAQNMVGVIHQDGLAGQADLAQAEIWFRRAAEQGDAKAQSNLGQLLGPDGPDATKHVEALKWLLLAYNQNEPSAQNILNNILRHLPPGEIAEARQEMAVFRVRRSNMEKW